MSLLFVGIFLNIPYEIDHCCGKHDCEFFSLASRNRRSPCAVMAYLPYGSERIFVVAPELVPTRYDEEKRIRILPPSEM